MCLTSPILDLTAHFLSRNTVYFLCRFRAIAKESKTGWKRLSYLERTAIIMGGVEETWGHESIRLTSSLV